MTTCGCRRRTVRVWVRCGPGAVWGAQAPVPVSDRAGGGRGRVYIPGRRTLPPLRALPLAALPTAPPRGGGIGPAGRAEPLPCPRGPVERAGTHRSGPMVPGVPPASGAGPQRGAGAAGDGSDGGDSSAPPGAACRSPTRLCRRNRGGRAGAGRGCPVRAGVGAAQGRRWGERGAGGGGAGGGAACRPRTCAARARARYIAGWRRRQRQLSSAARAAAAECAGVPPVSAGWLGGGGDNIYNNSDDDDDVNYDGNDDDGSGGGVEDGGDDGSSGGGGTGRRGAGGGGCEGALAAVTGSGGAGRVTGSHDRQR